ncbi:hypothetical protein BJD12_05265 [Xanthomonas vesicatoria ATCC 35937]|uniref:hypothetical protein n=1 Tax=Xanthomonas vesicatoria TaxID=56460 RepID=UPI0002DA81DE|nr:hypothetical protein [Xanthomonas vesicatoria]APP74764.1 hypothetical protein BJD12_05265 [Xanthomonas vesicatoria ATCC 35937]KTF35541.1 hypothetical protein LMG920_02320 [Xanthomonas vesicatoria]MCC8597664.1 hypothetical protein [Xanthomonas vesicatoria]MCC8606191.1 hypothetical protein [Xanthomonas vesicatoria]MDG4490222.1 hypothetical protein [Xanthomonas vesicatoria]
MTTRDLTDGLFVDPVSVDSVIVDPVIEAGANIRCAGLVAPATDVLVDAHGAQPRLQQLPAAHCPQAGLRRDWAQARATLLAPADAHRAAGPAQACRDDSPPRPRLH